MVTILPQDQVAKEASRTILDHIGTEFSHHQDKESSEFTPKEANRTSLLVFHFLTKDIVFLCLPRNLPRPGKTSNYYHPLEVHEQLKSKLWSLSASTGFWVTHSVLANWPSSILEITTSAHFQGNAADLWLLKLFGSILLRTGRNLKKSENLKKINKWIHTYKYLYTYLHTILGEKFTNCLTSRYVDPKLRTLFPR